MKLIRCHIENFGCFHEYDMEFQSGVNVLLHENGWGKTTLAAFLNAMFYGFESKRTKNVKENTRLRYSPWQGGKYGGYLDIEVDGTTYRIFRTFGETARFDTLKVIDLSTGNSVRMGDASPGEFLFSVDVLTFQHSVFISDDMVLGKFEDSLHARLSALVNQVNQEEDPAEALDRLNDEVKVYEKTGQRGRLGELSRTIAEKEERIGVLKASLQQQDEERKNLQEINARLEAVRQAIKDNRERMEQMSGAFSKQKYSQELIAEVDEEIRKIQQELDAILRDLGGDIPSSDEIDRIRELKSRISQLRKKEEAYNNPGKDGWKADDEELLRKFENGFPDEQELMDIQSKLSEEKKLREEREELTKRLAEAKVQEETLKEALSQASVATADADEKPRKKKGGVSISLGLIAIVAGIVLAVLIAIPFAGISAAGLVLLLFGVVQRKQTAGLTERASVSKRNLEVKELEAKITEAEAHTKALQDSGKELEEAIRKWEKSTASWAEKWIKTDGRTAEEVIRDLREIVRYTKRVLEGRKNNESERRKIEEKRIAAENDVREFIRKHQFFQLLTDDPVQEIAQKASKYAEQKQKMAKLEIQRDGYLQKDLGQQSFNAEDKDAIEETIRQQEQQQVALLRQHQEKMDYLRQADIHLKEYQDLYCELRQLKEEEERAKEKVDALKKASDTIKQAREQLSNQYLTRVEAATNQYLHDWKENRLNTKLNSDFEIIVEENGEEHTAKAYSSGYEGLMDFCMRLALVDTLFEKELPFLVLDDPFIGLDEKHLESAGEVLKQLGKSRQILYFVCHPMRAFGLEEETDEKVSAPLVVEKEKPVATRETRERPRATESVPNKTSTKHTRRQVLEELYNNVKLAGEIPFRPEKPDYTITNSIFNLKFVASNTQKMPDKTYELFFVDENGRVSSDRQMIEIEDGKMSKEKVLFSLHTREDSGNRFRLYIRENDQAEGEALGYYPFNAKLSFVGTDSFDLW